MPLIPLNTFKTKTAVLSTLNYNAVKCARDTGLIIDSIALDLLQNSTTQSSFAGLQYWSQGDSAIPGEAFQTLAALDRLKIVAKQVVLKSAVSDGSAPAGYLTMQVTTGLSAGTQASVNKVAAEIEIIYDIIQNGTAGATDLIIPNSRDSAGTGFANAATLLTANKEFLQTEIEWWLAKTFNGTPPYAITFPVKCKRDIGLIVDSLAFDLLFNGKTQSSFAGIQYWAKGSTNIPNEIANTIEAIKRLELIVNKIIMNEEVIPTPGNSIIQLTDTKHRSDAITQASATALFKTLKNLIVKTLTDTPNITNYYDKIIPNGYKTSKPAILNAVNLLQANKQFIQEEVVAYVDTIKTLGFTYDDAKCVRDVSYMLDCVCFDLLYGGNRQTIQAGVYYVGFSAIPASTIPNDISESQSAYNHLKFLIDDIISANRIAITYQQTVLQVIDLPAGLPASIASVRSCIDLITTIIDHGPNIDGIVIEPIGLQTDTDTTTMDAFNLLLANKEFLKEEIVAYVIQAAVTKSSAIANNNLCTRDIGYIIDCIVYDLTYAGNRQAVQAGVYYFNHSSASSVVPVEMADTVNAYQYMKTLIADVIKGTQPAISYQGEVRQYVPRPVIGATPASVPVPLTGTAAQISSMIKEVDSKVDLITSIIGEGPAFEQIVRKPLDLLVFGELVEEFDVATSIKLSAVGDTITINPTTTLDENTTYYVIVEPGTFRDESNNKYAGTKTYHFTTAATINKPTLVSPYSPVKDILTVVPLVETPIIFKFNKTVVRGPKGKTLTITITDINTGIATTTTIDSQSNELEEVDAKTFRITLVGGFKNNSKYRITATLGFVKDLSGNDWDGLVSGAYTFTTLDKVGPLATSYLPAIGTLYSNVVNHTLFIDFDEDISLVPTKAINIQCTNTTNIILKTTTLAVSGKRLTITVPSGFPPDGRNVTVIFDDGIITDSAANPWISTSYNFSTADLTAPSATFTPVSATVNNALTTKVLVQFAEPVTKVLGASGLIIIHTSSLSGPKVRSIDIATISIVNNEFTIEPGHRVNICTRPNYVQAIAGANDVGWANIMSNTVTGLVGAATNAMITTGIPARDGTNTAVRWIGTEATAHAGVFRIYLPQNSLSVNKSYTISFWARYVSGNKTSLKCDLADGINPLAMEYGSLLVQNVWINVTMSGIFLSASTNKYWFDIINDTPSTLTIELCDVEIFCDTDPLQLLPNTEYHFKFPTSPFIKDTAGNIWTPPTGYWFKSIGNNRPSDTVIISVSPSIIAIGSDIPKVGKTLIASNTLVDVDGLGPISYQWFADDTAIVGATATTLVLTAAHAGKRIYVTASYDDLNGTAESVASVFTVPVNTPPTGTVSITGTPKVGNMLTAASTLVDVDGLGTLSYQWYIYSLISDTGTVIAGATTPTLTLLAAQLGKFISVKVSYTDGFGVAESKESIKTAKVTV